MSLAEKLTTASAAYEALANEMNEIANDACALVDRFQAARETLFASAVSAQRNVDQCPEAAALAGGHYSLPPLGVNYLSKWVSVLSKDNIAFSADPTLAEAIRFKAEILRKAGLKAQ